VRLKVNIIFYAQYDTKIQYHYNVDWFLRHLMIWWQAILCLIYWSVIFRGEDKWLSQQQLAPCCRVPETHPITHCSWFSQWHPDKSVRQYTSQVLHRGPELMTTEFHSLSYLTTLSVPLTMETDHHVRITRISLLLFVTESDIFKLGFVKFHYPVSCMSVMSNHFCLVPKDV
jgi:hypothetical protein